MFVGQCRIVKRLISLCVHTQHVDLILMEVVRGCELRFKRATIFFRRCFRGCRMLSLKKRRTRARFLLEGIPHLAENNY